MATSRQHKVQESDIADAGFAALWGRIRVDDGDPELPLYWRAVALFQLGGLPRRTAQAYLARHPRDPMQAVTVEAARRRARESWRQWVIATGRSPAAADRWLHRDQRAAAGVQLARLRRFMGDDAYQPAEPLGWRQWQRDPRVHGPLPVPAKVAGRRALRSSSGYPLRRTGPGCVVTYHAGPDSAVVQLRARCIGEPLWIIQARTAEEEDALQSHGFPLLADDLGVAHE